MIAKEALEYALRARSEKSEENYEEVKQEIIKRAKVGSTSVVYGLGYLMQSTIDQLLLEGYMVSVEPPCADQLGTITIDWSAE